MFDINPLTTKLHLADLERRAAAHIRPLPPRPPTASSATLRRLAGALRRSAAAVAAFFAHACIRPEARATAPDFTGELDATRS